MLNQQILYSQLATLIKYNTVNAYRKLVDNPVNIFNYDNFKYKTKFTNFKNQRLLCPSKYRLKRRKSYTLYSYYKNSILAEESIYYDKNITLNNIKLATYKNNPYGCIKEKMNERQLMEENTNNQNNNNYSDKKVISKFEKFR